MIHFKCPNCNTVLQVSAEYAGQPVLCSACNTELIVPQMPVPEPSLNKADTNSIICICGQCKSTYKAPAASAGRQVPCPKCGHAALIPDTDNVVTDSQTQQWLDRDVVLGLLDRLRAEEVPSKRIARQLWSVLVFMVWHGVFVEERIVVDVPETVYPVKL